MKLRREYSSGHGSVSLLQKFRSSPETRKEEDHELRIGRGRCDTKHAALLDTERRE